MKNQKTGFINRYFCTKKDCPGFTLIELLVVIAIIGMLSAVVLGSLNSARGKGSDAAVKENLHNIRAQAEIVYDSVTPNSYATVCANAIVSKAVTAAGTAGGGTGTCTNAAGQWSAYAPLKGAGGFWCVDSTGTARVEVAGWTAPTGGAACP
jgi:prepilin-type N-terminal cleavage/methylation domain-containing protein